MTVNSRKRKSTKSVTLVPALFIPAVLAVTCGFLALLGLRLANAPVWDSRASGYIVLLGVVVLVSGLAGLLTGRSARPEVRVLVASTVFLTGMGVLMQHRVKGIHWDALTASDFAYLIGIPLAVVTSVLLKRGRYQLLAPFGTVSALVSIAGMVALIIIGTRFRGAVFYPGRMTPTELLKPLLIVFLAGLFQTVAASGKKRVRMSLFWWGWHGGIWCVLMLLLAYQRDLGMILILNTILACIAFAAHRRYGLAVTGALLATVSVVVVLALAPHARHRFDVWVDPFASPTGTGWQALQSLSALYNGGLFGTGLGEGSPKSIPVASSDFIYATIGEELGFLGCVLMLAVFGVMVVCGGRIAGGCKDPFGRLLAAGLTAGIAIQIILNVGGVTKAIPMTGVPLPFVSQGGMNLLVSFLFVGMLVSVGLPERRTARRSG